MVKSIKGFLDANKLWDRGQVVLKFAESFTDEGINTNALGNLNFNHFVINK